LLTAFASVSRNKDHCISPLPSYFCEHLTYPKTTFTKGRPVNIECELRVWEVNITSTYTTAKQTTIQSDTLCVFLSENKFNIKYIKVPFNHSSIPMRKVVVNVRKCYQLWTLIFIQGTALHINNMHACSKQHEVVLHMDMYEKICNKRLIIHSSIINIWYT